MNIRFLALSTFCIMSFGGWSFTSTAERVNPVTSKEEVAVRTIVINSNDQMRFDLSEIRVKAGETVRLTLNHKGKLPENVMGHNFVLLSRGTDISSFSAQAMNAKANDYIPSTGVIVHTDLIGGGESSTIEFQVPQRGTYDFICSFPGHYSMMKGKFIVE